MRPAAFPLRSDVVMLNHASYGVPTLRSLREAEVLRHEIEADSLQRLGSPDLTPRLRQQSNLLAAELGLDPESTTLTANATTGAAAVIDSAAIPRGATVAAFATEYSSIDRAWERACARVGATYVRVPVALPLSSADDVLAALAAAVPGDVAYVQMSAVSSSAALHFPVAEIATWTHDRGGRLILDAAHTPGHVPVRARDWGVDALFGTVHKWYPTLRPVGVLWTSESFGPIRPAEVSLTYDSPDLVERFSWPGTFDPVPRLGVASALEQWHEWEAGGLLRDAADLADYGTTLLVEAGAIPTAAAEFTPPRLRAFVLPEASPEKVKDALREDGILVWTGQGANGECLLRFATHVYTDAADLEALAAALRR